jgi:hypothetical protein
MAVATVPQESRTTAIPPNMVCRKIVLGTSRSSDVTICKTKAAWAASDACKGPTRYCSPEQKAAMRAKFTAFALTEDSRVICREVKGTGSRLSSAKVCLPNREWQRMWDNGRETTANIQDRFSKQVRSGDR